MINTDDTLYLLEGYRVALTHKPSSMAHYDIDKSIASMAKRHRQCTEEITAVLKKHNCDLRIQQNIVIVPISEVQPEPSPKEKKPKK